MRLKTRYLFKHKKKYVLFTGQLSPPEHFAVVYKGCCCCCCCRRRCRCCCCWIPLIIYSIKL